MNNMQAIATHTLATALSRAVAATLAGQVRAGSELVTCPDSDTAGVLYATVDRGNMALSQSWLLEAKSKNRVSENQ